MLLKQTRVFGASLNWKLRWNHTHSIEVRKDTFQLGSLVITKKSLKLQNVGCCLTRFILIIFFSPFKIFLRIGCCVPPIFLCESFTQRHSILSRTKHTLLHHIHSIMLLQENLHTSSHKQRKLTHHISHLGAQDSSASSSFFFYPLSKVLEPYEMWGSKTQLQLLPHKLYERKNAKILVPPMDISGIMKKIPITLQ